MTSKLKNSQLSPKAAGALVLISRMERCSTIDECNRIHDDIRAFNKAFDQTGSLGLLRMIKLLHVGMVEVERSKALKNQKLKLYDTHNWFRALADRRRTDNTGLPAGTNGNGSQS